MTSPISSTARAYVRARATEVMEYECRIERSGVPSAYDEDTLVYISASDPLLIYEGPCRIWELGSATPIQVGDSEVYQQATNFSIPWDTEAVIQRYDQVTITSAVVDDQMVGERFEIQSIAKGGELRATRRFVVSGVM